ncbi:MAG: DUF4105 domain-containing protein [Helicobacteraceae bacterium]|jgi:hypothetical protein|nr:DUF4105 domain-containing protein [Helicobacteraceae bacterium]
MRFFAVCALLLFALIARAENYERILIDKAVSTDLHNSVEWRRIVGYEKAFFGGEKSVMDDPIFFLAIDGKTNPKKELIATIENFVRGEYEHNRSIDPRCIYTSRYEFLKTALDIDEKLLKPKSCEEFDHWFNATRGEKMFLVFPAEYINNPASMFGHTFVRIDKNESVNALTSYAINYAAAASDDDNAVIYTFKGLLGFYPAYFSALPYAEKAKEYNDFERRNMWEYELDFTREEIDRFLLRAWELNHFYRDYFFFYENCSFVLYESLRFAKNQAAEDFLIFVPPIDTVREITRENNMILSVKFRPSQTMIIENLAANSNAKSISAAKDIVDERAEIAKTIENLTEDEKIDALEIAMEYSLYLFNKDKIETEEYKKLYFDLLRSRSKLKKREKAVEIKTPKRPDLGHKISRAAIGASVNNFAEKAKIKSGDFRVRPSYHNLSDPLDGYLFSSGVSAFDFWLKYDQNNSLYLREFTLLNIESFSPIDEFFKPISWRLKLGYENPKIFDKKNDFYYAKGGAGVACGGEKFLLYALLDLDFNLGENLEGKEDFYAGGAIGAVFSAGEKIRAVIEAKEDYDLSEKAAKKTARRAAKFEATYKIANDFDARLEANLVDQKFAERNLYEARFFVDMFF